MRGRRSHIIGGRCHRGTTSHKGGGHSYLGGGRIHIGGGQGHMGGGGRGHMGEEGGQGHMGGGWGHMGGGRGHIGGGGQQLLRPSPHLQELSLRNWWVLAAIALQAANQSLAFTSFSTFLHADGCKATQPLQCPIICLVVELVEIELVEEGLVELVPGGVHALREHL